MLVVEGRAQHTSSVPSISCPLAVGWGHVTSFNQWNIRSDWSHFWVGAMKSSATRISSFFLPLLLGPTTATIKQQCPHQTASMHDRADQSPCPSLCDWQYVLSHWCFFVFPCYCSKLLLLTSAIPLRYFNTVKVLVYEVKGKFNIIKHTV